MITKNYADTILNNLSEMIDASTCFKYKETICRDITKVREAIDNGFTKKR